MIDSSATPLENNTNTTTANVGFDFTKYFESLLKSNPQDYDYAMMKYFCNKIPPNSLDKETSDLLLLCCRTYTHRKRKLNGNLMPQLLRIYTYDKNGENYIYKFPSYVSMDCFYSFDFNDPRYFVYDVPAYVERSKVVERKYEMEKRLQNILKSMLTIHQRQMFTAFFNFYNGNVPDISTAQTIPIDIENMDLS